jgi:hypothetical protein
MARLANWQTALDRYIAESNLRVFSYDSRLGLDCCRFTWGAIKAQTGKPIGAQFADAYRTRRQALETMRLYCGRPSLLMSINKLMAEYGFAVVHPNFASRGDAVLVPKRTGGDFLGVLDMNGKDVLGMSDLGPVRVPISIRCRAWRIA